MKVASDLVGFNPLSGSLDIYCPLVPRTFGSKFSFCDFKTCILMYLARIYYIG